MGRVRVAATFVTAGLTSFALATLVLMTLVPERTVSPAPQPTQAEQVLAKHADTCWASGQAAKTKDLPTHAIIRDTATGRVFYTDKPVLVSAAFDEVLHEMGYGTKASQLIDTVALCI